MPRTETPVVVVGAGAAGLAAAAALRRRGLDPVVLEADERVGTTWARRYDRLHLHTVRRFSGLPYRPLSRELPRYVSKDDYARYLDDYARALGLDVRLGHRAERIEQVDGAWAVRTTGGDVIASAVVMATGKHREPRLPRWPGSDLFAGRLLHSAEYRSGAEFAGRRALVVGIGNSGAEIATDLADHGASFVAIAVRRTPPIVRRQVAGVPAHVLGMILAPFPPRPVDRLATAVRRVSLGDLRRYGLEPAAWGSFEARHPPVLDVGFVDALKGGRVHVRRALERLTETGAVFVDGREEPFDVVVAATGFSSGLARLLDLPGVLDEHELPRAGRDGSTAYPGLYFIGYSESPRGVLYDASREAGHVARSVSRLLATRAAQARAEPAPAPGRR